MHTTVRLILLSVGFLVLASACRPVASGESARPTVFDGAFALRLVVQQTEFGPRPAGSAANQKTSDWIIEQLEALGWQVETQEFVYKGTACRNVIGRMAQPQGEPVVLLGAHYDTRLVADRDPERPDEPVLGGNDGASGTAVLLELAHALEPDRIPYEVWLAFFDAEDNGGMGGWDWIAGSTYMAQNLHVLPEFAIVVDMVGDADQQIYYEHNSDPFVMQSIWQVADRLGYGSHIIPRYRHSVLDDHLPFSQIGIPSVDMIDFDYPYWHTTADTADKVAAESLERIGRTLESFLETDESR